MTLSILISTAFSAGAAEVRGTAAQRHATALVDTIAARHDLALTGSWDVLVPQRVMDADNDGVAVAVTLYALRDGTDIRALLLVQRNVLPSVTGFGAPAACADGTTQQSLTVYRSPRDVLCGWARSVSFSSPGNQAQMGTIVRTGLGGDAGRFGASTDRWMWFDLRVSNRNDFLDMQLLVPDRPEISLVTTQQFLADMAHSMNATWLTGTLAAVPAPPEARPAPEPTGSLWSGTLSMSAMRTMTYRAMVTVKSFLLASVMGANVATGGAIVAVLNITSTAAYLVNDYVWESWRPLTPPPQDFASLVDTK